MSALPKPSTPLKFTSSDLVIEVLSPGWANQQRDRQSKLKLYSRRGVQEYWLIDWDLPQAEIFRRENEQLVQVSTLLSRDSITSPLLPGFSCKVADLTHRIPKLFQP
jgi:Uma2 family endonuclease